MFDYGVDHDYEDVDTNVDIDEHNCVDEKVMMLMITTKMVIMFITSLLLVIRFLMMRVMRLRS